MKNNVVNTVGWSVAVIMSILFIVYFLFWDKIKKYFITEFWKSMSDKQYLNELALELMNDKDSLFSKKK